MPRFARFAVALAALALAAPAAAQGQTVVRHTLQSEALGQERTFLVRTPAGYEDHGAPYPVLYVTDGEAQLPLLLETVRFLAGHGRMPELIVVGIPHVDRTKELTPTRGTVAPGGPVLETSGGAGAFLSFLEKELIPFVERRYRTAPFRILAGHSFGGLFALHTLTERPDLFRARIAVSPTLGWDGDLPIRRVAALLERRPDLAGTLVFTRGDEGAANADAFRRFGEVVAKAGPRFRAMGLHLEGEDHGTVVFDSHYRALRMIFDGWRMPVEAGAVGPKGGLAAVEAHYRAVSERLGAVVAPPEVALNLAGYECLREGKHDEAIAALRRGVELYGGSPNAHDSLGEAYERSGDVAAALASYERAVALGTKRGDRLTPIFTVNRERAAKLGRSTQR